MSLGTPKTLHFEAAVLRGAPLPWEDPGAGSAHRHSPTHRRRDEDISRELQSLVGDIVRDSNANSSFDGSSRETPSASRGGCAYQPYPAYPEQEEDEFGIEDWCSEVNDLEEAFSPSHDPLEYIDPPDHHDHGDWIYGDISDGENRFPLQTTTLETENLPSFLSGKARKQVDDGKLQQYLLTANQVPEDQECSICYQPFSPAAVMLPCSINGCRSYFHGNCILPWLMQSASCPLCRCEIKVPNDSSSANKSSGAADRAPLVEALSSLLQELEEESRPWARPSPSADSEVPLSEEQYQRDDHDRPTHSSSSSSSSSSGGTPAEPSAPLTAEPQGLQSRAPPTSRPRADDARSSRPIPSGSPRPGLSSAPSTTVAAAAALLAAREEELAWLRRQRAADERTRARAAQFPDPKRQEGSRLTRAEMKANAVCQRRENQEIQPKSEASAATGSAAAPRRRQNLAAQALLRRGTADDR